MSEANNLQAPWTALPEINRFPREKKTTTKKQQPIRSEWGGGRRSGLLNINQQVSGERGESCGDAVSGPISISCSPARLQPRLRSDFYSTRQATSGTVTLFRSIIPAVLYTNHDMMHLWLSHPWRAGGGGISARLRYPPLPAPKWSRSSEEPCCQQVTMRPLWDELTLTVVSAFCVASHDSLWDCVTLTKTLICGRGLVLHRRRCQQLIDFHLIS